MVETKTESESDAALQSEDSSQSVTSSNPTISTEIVATN